jgi:hypothetical protein
MARGRPKEVPPNGFKYSLAYIVAGRREIGYDNAEGKGDHRHRGEEEEPYTFTTLSKLAFDFLRDIEIFKRNKK